MPPPLVFIDTSDVVPGKLSELRRSIGDLAAFVAVNEPRTIAYTAYFDDQGTRMTVLQIHPDSASMEYHLKVAAPLFPRFAPLVKMTSMEVYGRPSDALLQQLQAKARLLGCGEVRVHAPGPGFAR